MKKYLLRASMLSLAAVAVLSMSGCGGSSSSSDDGDSTPTTSDVISTVGKAVDGYLVYSTVCLDLSQDGYCQLGEEPATSTDENGSYTLTISAQQQEHKNFATAPLLVYGGYDSDTNADFTGKLKAPFDASSDASTNITPLTTMVEAMVAKGKDKTEAESAVKNMLGLESSVDLGADPVEEAKNAGGTLLKAALQLQKSLEVLSAALEENGATESSNELVEELYAALADKLHANENLGLDAALDAVVDVQSDLSEDAKAKAKGSAKAVSDQIATLVGDSTITGTAVIGTQIGAMQQKIVQDVFQDDTFIFNESDGLGDEFFSGLDDFQLLHAYEVLDIVDYSSSDYDAMASKVKAVLNTAGMPDDAFLPVKDEITALKANADTQAIGIAFEKRMNSFKDDADGVDILANAQEIPFNAPMTIYNFDDSEKDISLKYSVHSVLEKNVFEEYKMQLNESSGEFEKSTDANSSDSYTLSSDKLEMTVGDTVVKIIKKVDLANPADEDAELVNGLKNDLSGLTFAEGAEAYLLAFKDVSGSEWHVNESLEFNKAAFDSILSVIESSRDVAADNSSPLVGAWALAGENTPFGALLVIADNQKYFMTQQALGAEGVIGGVEAGVYTLDGNKFTNAQPVVNTNEGDTATADGCEEGENCDYNGVGSYDSETDTLTFGSAIGAEDAAVATRLSATTEHPEAGAWISSGDDGINTVLVFDGNGHYMYADLDLSTDSMEINDNGGRDNATEFGTYIIEDGVFTPTIADDTDFDATCDQEADEGCGTLAGNSNGNYGFENLQNIEVSFSDDNNVLNVSFEIDGETENAQLTRLVQNGPIANIE